MSIFEGVGVGQFGQKILRKRRRPPQTILRVAKQDASPFHMNNVGKVSFVPS